MSKQIYKFKSYKDFINSLVSDSPNKGRGLFRKISLYLNISSVTISQIFRGSRDLNLEQGLLLAEFFGFTELQLKYFLLMIQKEKSSHYQFIEYCKTEMLKLQNELEEVKNRVPTSQLISEKDKSIFYSHWKYSAVRLLTDTAVRNLN